MQTQPVELLLLRRADSTLKTYPPSVLQATVLRTAHADFEISLGIIRWDGSP